MNQDEQILTEPNLTKIEDDLQELYDELLPLFKRREQREHADTYLRGLLQPLLNKSVETMVLHMNESDAKVNEKEIRAMQHFISEGCWDDGAVLNKHWELVGQSMGDNDGVLIIDCSGFPKQGDNSVGVKRQWCGEVGKVANCQVGVFVGYATESGRTLLNRRLYMPEEWVEDEQFAERRKKCGVPSDIAFKTKPELAAEMVAEIVESQHLRFRWLTADEEYGRIPTFLDDVGQYGWYLAEVPVNTPVWVKRPKTEIPEWCGKGRKPTKERLVAGEAPSQTVAGVIANLPPEQWHRHQIKEGSKGPIVCDMLAIRVINSRNGLPGEEVWLVCRRNLTTGEIHYFLSNAPAHVELSTFAKIAGMRWPIETCFEEGKQQLGMGDYQMRSWTGWHHHMTLVILAHGFLMRMRHKLADEAPRLTLPQLVLLLKALLPQPTYDLQSALNIVNYYQKRHAAAEHSHRKRRMAQLNQRLE